MSPSSGSGEPRPPRTPAIVARIDDADVVAAYEADRATGLGRSRTIPLRHRDGSSIAEVDVMEYFHSQVPGKTSATLHLDRTYNVSKKTAFFEAPTTNPGWHTWAVEIVPVSNGVKFTFFLDGNAIQRVLGIRPGREVVAAAQPLIEVHAPRSARVRDLRIVDAELPEEALERVGAAG